jgi:hypothetical protein
MTVSVKGGAVMTSNQSDVEQRERQARIEQDIRQLFARYRRAGRNGEPVKRPERTRPARRFVRDAERVARRSS